MEVLSDLMECILSVIRIFNDNYSTAALFVISIVTLAFVYKEYNLNKRPKIFVIPKSQSNRDGGFTFAATLKNVGKYPANIKTNKIRIKIGDIDSEDTAPQELFSIAPGDESLSITYGSISENEIQRLNRNDFESNKCELYIELLSGGFTDKKLKYKSEFIYEVIFGNEVPNYKPIEHKIY